jgi:hypothetical protein
MRSYPRTATVFERGRPGADRVHLRPRGEFWDELRALFKHRAKVEIVAETSAAPA